MGAMIVVTLVSGLASLVVGWAGFGLATAILAAPLVASLAALITALAAASLMPGERASLAMRPSLGDGAFGKDTFGEAGRLRLVDARFYFDVERNHEVIRDDEGVEAPSLDRAIDEAGQVIREMIHEIDADGDDLVLVIRDGTGRSRARLPIATGSRRASAARRAG